MDEFRLFTGWTYAAVSGVTVSGELPITLESVLTGHLDVPVPEPDADPPTIIEPTGGE